MKKLMILYGKRQKLQDQIDQEEATWAGKKIMGFTLSLGKKGWQAFQGKKNVWIGQTLEGMTTKIRKGKNQ